MSSFSLWESVSCRLEKILPKAVVRDLEKCHYEELVFYHFTLGEYFRSVILDEKGDLYRWFYYDLEIHKKDDMSDLMLKMFYLYLKGRDEAIDRPLPEDEAEPFRYI